ncbi:DUF6492 family protein [Calothrix sp. PCC 7507]|uniref:DUF6492 family protein n=1 Tax=Calothrix sp. PCC 7507 TaxID=99598 RepID=UPI00029ED8CB|nr:DUF6492 family protein [Calothrix sp. PCC 7507]AFY35656.1 hypothetical protein Cal7507_5319 [Calothrix sp. PCC 7507]
MNNLEFGIITPSYAPDFERCKLLSWSIQNFISPAVTHYIIVDARDLPLFRQLKSPNTEIIAVESMLPWWIQRLPLVKNGWLSLKTVFIRNWLLQQIVKLAVAQHINKDIFVFVDSDVTFIRPFNLQSFVREDQTRLFRVPNQYNREFVTKYPRFEKWRQTASNLLGINQSKLPTSGYVGNIITWRHDNLLKLYEHIEKVSGRGWMKTICGSLHLSEYILYGIFVDQVLQDKSGHYYDSERICHEYWSNKSMSDQQLQKFFAETLPEDKAVMISAKAGITPQRYQQLLLVD